jgi:toxin ParE1/3/4
MKEVIWSPEAQADLAVIDEFYSDIDPDYADRVGWTAIQTARYLSENPYLGPSIEQGDIRKWRIPKSPYLLLYSPTPSGINVVRVRHGHEDWKPAA